MRSSLDRLTGPEHDALARLYETDGYRALKKLCQAEVDALAKDALGAETYEQVRYLRGRADMAKALPELIRQEHKRYNKG